METDEKATDMKRVLVEAIAFLAAFLELSGDETIDPDAAIQQEDNLSRILQALDFNHRLELLQYVEDLAKEYEQETGYDEFVQFLRTFGESFNLIEAPID